MVWLVMIHVLSAVLGLGPAFAFPWMLRSVSTMGEMKRNLQQVANLEVFPKIFGTLAILSGLALFFFGSYGPFAQTWILGSLGVYVLIEILVIGLMNPAAKQLLKLLGESQTEILEKPSLQLNQLYSRVQNLHLWSGVLGILIFILMIVKPH